MFVKDRTFKDALVKFSETERSSGIILADYMQQNRLWRERYDKVLGENLELRNKIWRLEHPIKKPSKGKKSRRAK